MSVEVMLETIIITVVSGLILESIREHRKKGKQILEKCYDFIRDVVSWLLQKLAKE
jgi:hypothetical protein